MKEEVPPDGHQGKGLEKEILQMKASREWLSGVDPPHGGH